MPQPSGGPVDSRVPGEVGAPVDGVTVIEPVIDVALTPQVTRPSWRIVRLAREVARFVHDLLSEVP